LEKRKLASLLVTNPLNIAYLTGFRGSAGIAAIGPSGSILWVDPRYTLQAGEDAIGVTVREARRGLLAAAGAWLARRPSGVTGIDEFNLTAKGFEDLKRQTGGKVRFHPAGGIIEDLRMTKDDLEIARIRAAGRVTSEALAEVLPDVRPGARESDLAAEIEYRMRRRGAEAAAFESIVASGKRGALPHARASRKSLEKFDLVIIDVGAILDGYVADMTRTVFLGKPTTRVRRLYTAVLEAQEAGINAIVGGVRASAVDSAARGALRRHGLERYFTHSTGHGVGMEVHETPRVGRSEKSRLTEGCVVTVEPGIYLEGFGGIRIEDTVLVGPNGPEILTPASKTDWILD
jgi:Xaa-Pro aminopeptidase